MKTYINTDSPATIQSFEFAYLFEQVLNGGFGFFLIFCRLGGDIGYSGELGVLMKISFGLSNN